MKAWESKNAKNAAKAGGISLMALSLAACGGSSTTTTAVVDTTPVVDPAVAAAEAAQAAAEAAQATAEAAQAAAEADLAAALNPAGQTIALTSSADVQSGGAGDDTFTATSGTYGTGDVVIGSDGSDTLNIAATGNVAAATSVTGVEVINVNAAVFATASYDAAGVTGATINFNNTQTGGATSATVNNVGSSNSVVSGTQVTGTLTVDLTSTSANTTIEAGAARIVTLTDAGSGGVTVNQTNVGTSVSGTTDNEISVDGDGDVANDVATVSSNGVVSLETAATDQVENITLSGNSQSATYTLTAGNAPEKVTFAGDQDVTLVMAALDATTETFVNNLTGDATATVRINADDTADLSKVATSIVIDIADGTTGGDTYSLADNATVKVTAATTTATLDSTVATNGTTETLNLIIDDTGNQTTFDVSDFEVVNISGSDTSATVAGDGIATIATLTGAATTAFVASGSVNLTLGSTAATAKSIDASALTGKLVTTMSANSKIVTGGEGNDTITGYAGNMTIDGNGGSDTLVFAAAADLTGATLSITDLETVSITAAGAVTLEMNASDVTGEAWIVKGTGTEDTLDVTLDSASVDLSGLVIDDTTVAVTYTDDEICACFAAGCF